MASIRKLAESAIWVVAKIGSRALANALIFFWLAYELTPNELGVAALGVSLAMFTLPMVIRGVREVVIQPETLDERSLSSAFVLNVCIGTLLCLALMLASPVLAPVLGDPRLATLGSVAAVIPLFAAVSSLQESLCERAFAYRRISGIYALGTLVASGAAIAVALAGQAIWALVVLNVATYATVAGLMWLKGPWRMRARPQVLEMQRMLRFSVPVMFSQTLATGGQRIVELIVGAVLTPAAAAFLRFGGNFTRLLHQIFVTPVIQVLMPAFSRSTARPEDNLIRVLTFNGAVLFFVFMMAAALLPDFIRLVFGDKWAVGGTVASILCFGVYAALLGSVTHPLLISKGHGDWVVVLTVGDALTLCAFVALGSRFGAPGAAAGFVLRAVVSIPLILWVLHRTLAIPPGRVLGAFLPFALAGGLVCLAVWGLMRPAVAGLPYGAALPLQICGGLALYMGLLRLGLRRLAPDAHAVLCGVLPARARRLL